MLNILSTPYPFGDFPCLRGRKLMENAITQYCQSTHPLCPPETGATRNEVPEGVDKNHSPHTAPNPPPPPLGWSSVAQGSAPLMRYKMTFSHFSKDLIHPLPLRVLPLSQREKVDVNAHYSLLTTHYSLTLSPLTFTFHPFTSHFPIRKIAGIFANSGIPVCFHSRMVRVCIHSSGVVMPAAMHMRVSGRKVAQRVSNILRLR